MSYSLDYFLLALSAYQKVRRRNFQERDKTAPNNAWQARERTTECANSCIHNCRIWPDASGVNDTNGKPYRLSRILRSTFIDGHVGG